MYMRTTTKHELEVDTSVGSPMLLPVREPLSLRRFAMYTDQSASLRHELAREKKRKGHTDPTIAPSCFLLLYQTAMSLL
jgi:hypothetical protein